jgi:hypothetical protein
MGVNSVAIRETQTKEILLRVPPDNSNATAAYRLRVEGVRKRIREADNAGAVFEHEAELQFSRKFLSIIINTNKMVFTAEHDLRIRVVMLTTSLQPYRGVADLFIIDPDGYIIRKWNSMHLNVGVMTQTFLFPEYPKVT